VSTPTLEEISDQQELLITYRRSLAHQLYQQAAQGGPAYVLPAVANGICDARDNIRRIKSVLGGWGVAVEQHPDDEEPERVPLGAPPVGQGLVALSELMRAADVRAAVVAFRADFQAARGQIDLLAAHKRLHDLFQELESCYNLIHHFIYQDGKLMPAERVAWEGLECNEPALQGKLDELLDFAGWAVFAADTALWSQKLGRASADLQAAIEGTDVERLRVATGRIKDVLGRELSRVNTRLVSAAGALRLPALVSAMTTLHETLARLSLAGPAQHRLSAFGQDVADLARLSTRLTALIDEHDRWQAVDDELRRVEVLLEQNMVELHDAWCDLEPMVRALCRESAADWSLRLQAIGADLAAALADGNPLKVKRHFRGYRSKASLRFNQVDRDLLTLCEDLQKVGEPLDSVLHMLESTTSPGARPLTHALGVDSCSVALARER
jgi:hypothetical protein